eukprot:6196283-Pleurochrysis_carterae.AAC.4
MAAAVRQKRACRVRRRSWHQGLSGSEKESATRDSALALSVIINLVMHGSNIGAMCRRAATELRSSRDAIKLRACECALELVVRKQTQLGVRSDCRATKCHLPKLLLTLSISRDWDGGMRFWSFSDVSASFGGESLQGYRFALVRTNDCRFLDLAGIHMKGGSRYTSRRDVKQDAPFLALKICIVHAYNGMQKIGNMECSRVAA